MSQDTDKYLYFQVGLLKDSFALEALWQDALRYHMTDQPAKLIAIRLTEYYELTSKGSNMQSRATVPAPTPSTVFTDGENKEDGETPTSSTPAIRPSAQNSPVLHSITHLPSKPLENIKFASNTANPAGAIQQANEVSLTVSAEVDQNAEEAADYWSLL